MSKPPGRGTRLAIMHLANRGTAPFSLPRVPFQFASRQAHQYCLIPKHCTPLPAFIFHHKTGDSRQEREPSLCHERSTGQGATCIRSDLRSDRFAFGPTCSQTDLHSVWLAFTHWDLISRLTHSDSTSFAVSLYYGTSGAPRIHLFHVRRSHLYF